DHLFCDHAGGWNPGKTYPLGGTRCGPTLVRPSAGVRFRLFAGSGGQRGRRSGSGSVCTAVGIAAIEDCAVYPDDEPGVDLGRSSGVASSLLGWMGLVAHRTAAPAIGTRR